MAAPMDLLETLEQHQNLGAELTEAEQTARIGRLAVFHRDYHPSMRDQRKISRSVTQREAHTLEEAEMGQFLKTIVGLAVSDPPAFGAAAGFISRAQVIQKHNEA